MSDQPRLVLAGPEPLPAWLLALRRVLRKTRRGWRRLERGCWFQHSPGLRKKPLPEGGLDLECPTCDLVVRTVLPDQTLRIKKWDEAAHQRSEWARKNKERRHTG